ncbi:flagellar biosynthesis protein FlgJ [Novosphingobium sp. FGD1]|jgi:peptidoglycan hydrolase FlgJ|uniref:Flagellar biosynthesis protein FlgJ n=1 Tax=Novosphingobium silvae TaxID=2692619 RepID=A0A7X4GFA6_9SPHN|nr:rod-binding protein [Novosphingobium silvae]MYL97526.1 flagellar biosynthesis protein FlgJ [Novosphingobium silvae]
MSTILPPVAGMAAKADATDREKLHVVAKQFEALFVREMLAAARKTSFGGEGGAGDIEGGQGLETFRQLQDERFADVTVQSGVLGLAKMLEEQMARFVPDSPGSGADEAAAAPKPGS